MIVNDHLISAASGWLALGFLTLGVPLASAAEYNVTHLQPTDLRQGDRFGAAVAVSDDVIAVGAYLSDDKDSGAVYLYRKSGKEWKLFPGMPLRGGPGEWFGFDVALQGSNLVVGAPHPGSGPGAAYVYRLNLTMETVDRQAVLTVPGARNGDEVGSAVAIDGNLVAVGARGVGGRAGRVYVFPVAGGGPTKILPVTPPPAGVELGQSVALRGDRLVAGAPLPGKDGQSPGMAYVFSLQTGTTDLLLPPPEVKRGAAFGYSVAIAGTAVMIGVPLADVGGLESGAVYRFPEGKPPGDRVEIASKAGDQLGVAIAADGDDFVVGARGADGRQGIAYLYDGTLSPLKPKVRATNAELGFGTAIHGETIVVGAFKEAGRGAVYVFEPAEPLDKEFHFDKSERSQGQEGETVTVWVVLETNRPLVEPETLGISVSVEGQDDLAINPVTVTFAAKSADDAKQEVKISLLPDCFEEEKEAFDLILSDSGGKEVDRHKVRILDGENRAGVLVSGNVPWVTNDAGGEVVFNLSLTCQPTDDVTINVASEDLAEAKVVSPPDLIFPAEENKWSEPQSVTVRGQKDHDADCADESFQVKLTLSSNDPAYAGVIYLSGFVNEEDESACVSASAEVVPDVCSNEDGTVLYTLKIKNTGNVDLANQAGPEILEALPAEVTVVTASADRGVATLDHVENEVAWNGSIPVGERAIIGILATLEPDAEGDVIFKGAYVNGSVNAPFEASFVVEDVKPCEVP